MKYIVSIPKPNTHFIEIEYLVENINTERLLVQLPAWRPGRYELQHFAKNIQKWAAFDADGQPLKFKKISKDSWQIETKEITSLHIKYNYYAAQLDAGACWLDEAQLYVNPVHCFLYIPERMSEPCTVEIQVPADYKIATGMDFLAPHTLSAKDYDTLVDCPFIASNALQHGAYKVGETQFHIWFQGVCRPDWERIQTDFKKFTEIQMNMMESFPSKDYHFLIQVLPHHFYHGVEHLNSTVLAIGPGYDLMNDSVYPELLGLASHELFHAWNVKAIRPVEMMPYDYTKENYSNLGYVCEGVTTYYGDLFLLRSGVFSEAAYFQTFNQQLQKHFDNPGRFNLSVAGASFDTWLDGYCEGIPGRKTSIYTEGCLLAFITDCAIRKQSNNLHSLDTVMHLLYSKYGNKKQGYSEQEYKEALEKISGTSFDALFNNQVHGTQNYEPLLNEALNFLGLELIKTPAKFECENKFGFKVVQNGQARITHVWPDSAGEKNGLCKDDELLSVNGMKIQNSFHDWMLYFQDKPIELVLARQGRILNKIVQTDAAMYYPKHSVKKIEKPAPVQEVAFRSWSRFQL